MPTSALGALLQEPRVIGDQHAFTVPQMLDHIAAHIVADTVHVPVRAAQQPLHPIRADLASAFRQRPPILAFQARNQPDTYSRTRARGSDRENRPAIRSCTRSSSAAARSTTMPHMIPYRSRKCRCNTKPYHGCLSDFLAFPREFRGKAEENAISSISFAAMP